MPEKSKNSFGSHQQVYRIAVTGMLIALAFLAMLIGRLIPNVAGILSYDPKDAVIAISGFIFGPVTAVVIAVIVSFLEMITISGTGFIGLFMNVLSTCSFVVPAIIIYRYRRNRSGVLIGLASGIVFMTLMMMFWDYWVMPLYSAGVTQSDIGRDLMVIFMPFNVSKGGMNAAIALLLYKPIVQALRRAHLVPQSSSESQGKNRWLFVIGIIALVVFVVLFVYLILHLNDG